MSGFILFDLDGTLIDGVDDLVFSINAVLATRGLGPLARHELEPMLGDGMRMLARRAFAARRVDLSEPELDAAYREFVGAYKATAYVHTRLFHGVAETLRRLHGEGWRIGLASNKLTEPCRDILARLGILDLFTVVAGGDATTVRKPDAGHLRYALEQMGYRPAEGRQAVMVGDHGNDVQAARGAGLYAIAVALEVDDARARSLGADAVLTDFTGLPAALATLAASFPSL